ncbi:unnamed protein product [Paramecium sonneborni]|uniref:Uncharacterized protein n=1 Tax=Paramecium sonneborni TaxID=65129 RepID=A0A8S1RVW4_9CILI|nr:unnamed protein product [Paramecium sonneborni]
MKQVEDTGQQYLCFYKARRTPRINLYQIPGVYTLNFMKKQNQFISGKNNEWISQQRLNGHIGYIFCLILNNNEDIIISGSADKTIKFWMNKNKWLLCQQTITDHSNYIYELSLSQQQNRVISCGYDKQILIIEQSQQKKNALQYKRLQLNNMDIEYVLLIIICSHSNQMIENRCLFLR